MDTPIITPGEWIDASTLEPVDTTGVTVTVCPTAQAYVNQG